MVILSVTLHQNLATAESNFCKRNGDGAFANPKGCNWYIECQSGVLTETQCHEGEVFDANETVCVSKTAAEVNCKFDNTVNVACPSKGTDTKPNPYSCRKYFVCEEGAKREEQCPIEYSFSKLRGQCMPDEKAECTADRDLICPLVPADNFVFRASKLDCEVYYLCLTSAVHQLSCASGFHFSQDFDYCDVPENVQCTPEPTGPPPTTLPPTPSLPNVTETECPDWPGIVYVPHPEDCQHYFICFHGRFQLFRCADGLLFDTVSGQCDIESRAQCFSNSSKPTTAQKPEETTVSTTEANTSSEPDTTPQTAAPEITTEAETATTPAPEGSEDYNVDCAEQIIYYNDNYHGEPSKTKFFYFF